MKVDIKPGRYVLGVSGGVDSMVLLDVMSRHSNVEVIVAHFNHGIRDDSKLDERLVKRVADKYGLDLEIGHAKLGKNASEDTARKARYAFLAKMMATHKAKAIVTAHHRDDMVETALINTLRGTKRRGLTSIADNKKILRPMLKIRKQQIIRYAKAHKLKWREDSTNKDERYLRNFLRPRIAKLSARKINDFGHRLDETSRINRQIDSQIAMISQLLIKDNQIERQQFIMLPAEIARELIQHWLRQAGLTQADRKLIDRSANFIKTGMPGTKLPLSKNFGLRNTTKRTMLWKA